MLIPFGNYLRESVRQERKALRIFDFDDTLAQTEAAIRVIKGGNVIRSLSSDEFKHYHLGPGESFDYSGSNLVVNPRPIPAVLKILRAVRGEGKRSVILTGRSEAEPVRQWMRSIGINIEVFTVGSPNASHESIARDKKAWIVDAIRQGYNDIEFLDDNARNIAVAKTIKHEFPYIRFTARLIKYKPKQRVYEARDYRAEYLKMYGGNNPTPKQRRAMKKKTARKRVLRRMGREGRSNDGREIDHKNGNALDSRPSNLRLVSRHTNRSKDNNKWQK